MKIGTVMHGYVTWEYLGKVAEQICWTVSKADFELIFDLDEERKRLSGIRKIVGRAHGESTRWGHTGETMLLKHKEIWISKLIIYNQEDIQALKEGKGILLRTLTDRQWNIGHTRN